MNLALKQRPITSPSDIILSAISTSASTSTCDRVGIYARLVTAGRGAGDSVGAMQRRAPPNLAMERTRGETVWSR